ncbi:MAG TPA: hypothetical protein VHM25_16920 [Polyangiaceae bacterium]|nr:hypothetical protein [Polyangiaceae bacterium]
MARLRGFRAFGRVWVSVTAVLGACGTPAAPAPLSPEKAGAHAASPAELAEVGTFVDHGAPNGVLLWLRVPAPGRDIPLLGTLLGVGSMFEPSEVASRQLGPALSRAIDWSKPVDLTTAGLDDGPMRVALAAGIVDPTTFFGQVSGEFAVVHASQGRFQLVPKAKSRPGAFGCELWHAAPPVGARLICATQSELIDQQGEFLMAAARTRVDHSNVHAELPGQAARELLRKSSAQQASKHRASDDSAYAAGQAMGEQWISDWVRDSSGFSWDLTLRRDSLELSQEMGFSRSDSWFSTALAGRTGPTQTVPDAFWRLPNDSDAALYFEGAEPEPMRRQAASLIHTLRVAMDANDEFESPPDRLDQFEHTFARLILRGGAFELAYGRDLNQAARALAEAAEHAADRGPRAGSLDPALKKAQARLGAWGLLGIEDDSRAYLQALRDALRFATDKTQQPRKKNTKPSSPSPSNWTFAELPLAAPAGLPADALHFVARSEPDAKYLASKAKPAAPAPSVYHLIAVPDAPQHLWLAIASDEALAIAKLRALLSPEPSKTLAASDELRQLAKQPLAGLGFASLAGLNGFDLSAESKDKVRSSRAILKQLWGLPKHGSTRMPLWITRAQGSASQRRIAYNVRFTPDAIADLLAIFMTPDSEAEAGENK